MTARRGVTGEQEPRVKLVPRAASNDVDDAVFLASRYGLTPDEWQETVLEGWLGKRADGLWSSPRCGLAVPRQNGKNGVLEVRELFGMVVLGERFLHTAHEVKTARKAFLRLQGFFDNPRKYPELAELVADIRKTNGQEAIVLHNGGSIEFIARSKGSGRGFSVDVLVLDEAQELSDDALAALLPTISASPNPQQIVTGTPPGPTMTGEVFTRLRNAGVAGTERRLCWMEWSCESTIGNPVDLDDRGNWGKANPALGIRLSADTISDERSAMDEETFGRERLGMWAKVAASNVIDPAAWAEAGDAASQVEVPVAFAVHTPQDRSWTSIAVAGQRADGMFHVELIDRRRGTGWVTTRVMELRNAWKPVAVVIDGRGAASTMIPDLEQGGVPILATSAGDMARACGLLYDSVTDGTLRHLDQGEVNDALAGAKTRDLSGAWAWSAKNVLVDIAPLVAVTLALHGFVENTRTAAEESWGFYV